MVTDKKEFDFKYEEKQTNVLNISKTHVENLGESINFESEENKVILFTISITNTAIPWKSYY